ncbi:hypothetical protein PMI02_01149 [Novosphingobium sp. AP12]|nr:hypothetical protein PMI02_01149 [Novosphingobium sp. AP12]
MGFGIARAPTPRAIKQHAPCRLIDITFNMKDNVSLLAACNSNEAFLGKIFRLRRLSHPATEPADEVRTQTCEFMRERMNLLQTCVFDGHGPGAFHIERVPAFA